MTVKLHVGYSRKLGLPGFGSVGATCLVEFTDDETTTRDSTVSFQSKVRSAFQRCREAVHEELARKHRNLDPMPSKANTGSSQDLLLSPELPLDANDETGDDLDGFAIPKSERPASASQLAFVRRLAERIPRLGEEKLDATCRHLYRRSLQELSNFEASRLIDRLKTFKENNGRPANAVQSP